MRDFSWKIFTLTGDVDAFLLYREMDELEEREKKLTPESLDSLDHWDEVPE
ncbi:YqzL family protein [Thermobacillus sp. ZCTH02-B1]|uniref:YqzL family protein n=1 Tax=Thermobacillus sp. ZCTH02-B1 TaxID=1858795 RepID=UPI0025E8938C|nr:YqzL family protein [Thermobacillus sp. ZCTH02-B1]